MSRIIYSWRTKKNEDGTFTGMVTKTLTLDKPVNGYCALEAIEAKYNRNTRARAKAAAIRGMMYYKHQLTLQNT